MVTAGNGKSGSSCHEEHGAMRSMAAGAVVAECVRSEVALLGN